ncbi:LCP family protein [Micromonospora sp. LOL_021]|uniref:LCP family protein n=1 Tax=Micromonospora sp. LOL_021 TaxID=3345417 RepID=UPI003A840168
MTGRPDGQGNPAPAPENWADLPAYDQGRHRHTTADDDWAESHQWTIDQQHDQWATTDQAYDHWATTDQTQWSDRRPASSATSPVALTRSSAGSGQHRRPPARHGRRRLRRIALLGITGLVVAALAGVAGVAAVSHYYLGEIKRIPDPFAAIPADQRPAPTAEGLTVLLAGVDSLASSATGADSPAGPYGRTDSLMVVRITADRERAYVVSIPRDSWVPVPGHGNVKINSAYALGGASLAVRTVENVTGLRIDHVALIDLVGLQDLTDAVGGVTVEIPAGTPGPSLQSSWPAGPQRLNGEQAVKYVRQRYGLPEGDFDRMRRHQNYLRALLDETLDRDTLTSPRQLGALLDAITTTVTVDDGLTNDKLRQLSFDLRKIRNDVRFVTAPVANTGFVGDQWVMWLDTDRGVDFWTAVRDDTLEQYIERYGAEQLDSVVVR